MHILAAVTAHGYGHLSQISPVLNALLDRLPGSRLTIMGDLNPHFIEERLEHPFQYLHLATDPGLLMHDPWRVAWNNVAKSYAEYHKNFKRSLTDISIIYEIDRPDLVLVDIPWIPIVAAKQLNIPVVAICSLNWADILSANPLCTTNLGAELSTIRAAYQEADLFLQPSPAMPMDWLKNARRIGSLGYAGENLNQEILEQLDLPSNTKLILAQFGGISGAPMLQNWPKKESLHWLLKPGYQANRDDMTCIDRLKNMSFNDIIASVDIMLTKPGYNSFVEAAMNGLPVLYTPRGDWAEEPYLEKWLKEKVHCAPISRSQLENGDFHLELKELLSSERRSPTNATGTADALSYILPLLD